MEEEKANGAPIDDGAINGIKIGLMGPLAGVGHPIFWGALVSRWTSVNVPLVVSKITNQQGKLVVTTVQDILNQLIPELIPLALTFLCMSLLRKKVSAVWIIFGLFAVGILGYWAGVLS